MKILKYEYSSNKLYSKKQIYQLDILLLYSILLLWGILPINAHVSIILKQDIDSTFAGIKVRHSFSRIFKFKNINSFTHTSFNIKEVQYDRIKESSIFYLFFNQYFFRNILVGPLPPSKE